MIDMDDLQEGYDKNGKRCLILTKAQADALVGTGVRIYHGLAGDPEYMMAPLDCDHDYEVHGGLPRNIKGCKKCIYWEFTNDSPTK